MTTVAVVAHEAKTLGGGLGELRERLATEGFPDPVWHQVRKSKQAPKAARKAVADGADLIFVWGGDGTVQRCIDAVVGTGVAIAILPAGTANLLATNLGIPTDLEGAIRIGLHGVRRPLDTGKVNGEHFAVMAGTGFDAMMIKDAGRGLKDRVGRLAYVWTGARNLGSSHAKGTVTVDGRTFYRGTLSCVLVGNVGKLFGGLTVFEGALPDDGILELGVVSATSALQWARTLGRTAFGRPERSPYVRVALGRRIRVDLDRPLPYELDGGDRPATRRLKIRVVPASVLVCVPG